MGDRGTLHGTAFEEMVSRELCEQPSLGQTMAEILGRLRRGGVYERGLVDAIFQKWDRSPTNFSDAFGFAIAYTRIIAGVWRIARIHVGTGPSGDKAVVLNNDALRNLNPQFSAEFVGGHGDHDGMFRWHDHLHLGGYTNVGGKLVDGPTTTIKAASISLEVGTQAVSKTLFQMREQRALARWPYGSDHIWVIVDCSTKWARFAPVETECSYDVDDGWECAYKREALSERGRPVGVRSLVSIDSGPWPRAPG